MSTTPGTEIVRRLRWPQSTYGPSSTAEPAASHREDAFVAVPVVRVNDRPCDAGVAMCFLPRDISLRAYAIAAVNSAAARHGLDIAGRRDVPIRPEVVGAALADLPHVVQFFIHRPGMVETDTFETELRQLQGSIECAMISMGLTDEDFRLVSCSSRQVIYAVPGGSGDPAAFYPDLSGAQVDHRQVSDSRRSPRRA